MTKKILLIASQVFLEDFDLFIDSLSTIKNSQVKIIHNLKDLKSIKSIYHLVLIEGRILDNSDILDQFKNSFHQTKLITLDNTVSNSLQEKIIFEKINNKILEFALDFSSKQIADKYTSYVNIINNSIDLVYNSVYSLPIESVVQALCGALDAKCGYTHGHSLRVAKIANLICHALDLDNVNTYEITLGALLHDIGKIAIPEAILWKESGLNETEKTVMDTHPVISAKIVESLKPLSKVKSYILHHHEFINGKGYPNNLEHNEIPLGSKIILIADAYDAMTSDRPYRKSIGHEKAINELLKHKGQQFDAEIVSVFIETISKIKNFNVDNLPSIDLHACV